MKMNILKWAAGLSALAGLFALASCGGSGGSGGSDSSRAAGKLSLTVKWPTRSRLIPPASNSIKAVVTVGSSIIGTHLFVGSDGPPSSPQVFTFTNLPAGTVTLTATAFPTTTGTGVAQATGSVPASIVSG